LTTLSWRRCSRRATAPSLVRRREDPPSLQCSRRAWQVASALPLLPLAVPVLQAVRASASVLGRASPLRVDARSMAASPLLVPVVHAVARSRQQHARAASALQVPQRRQELARRVAALRTMRPRLPAEAAAVAAVVLLLVWAGCLPVALLLLRRRVVRASQGDLVAVAPTLPRVLTLWTPPRRLLPVPAEVAGQESDEVPLAEVPQALRLEVQVPAARR
jgi:hypothetical protein